MGDSYFIEKKKSKYSKHEALFLSCLGVLIVVLILWLIVPSSSTDYEETGFIMENNEFSDTSFRIGFPGEDSAQFVIGGERYPSLDEISFWKQRQRESQKRYEAARRVGESERFYRDVKNKLEDYYEDYYEDLFDDLRIEFNDDHYDRFVENFELYLRANYDEDEITRDERMEVFQYYLQQYNPDNFKAIRDSRI